MFAAFVIGLGQHQIDEPDDGVAPRVGNVGLA